MYYGSSASEVILKDVGKIGQYLTATKQNKARTGVLDSLR